MLVQSIRRYLAERRRRAERAKPPQRQVAEYMGQVRSCFPTELASLLAAALLAKKSLDTTRQVDVPFPETYFNGTADIDDAALAELRAYEQKLQDFREQLVRHNTIFSLGVARGISVWIASIHTLANADLRADGLDLWERLTRGEDQLEEAYRMLLRREITDVERVYMQYRPKVLMPTEPRVPRMTIG